MICGPSKSHKTTASSKDVVPETKNARIQRRNQIINGLWVRTISNLHESTSTSSPRRQLLRSANDPPTALPATAASRPLQLARIVHGSRLYNGINSIRLPRFRYKYYYKQKFDSLRPTIGFSRCDMDGTMMIRMKKRAEIKVRNNPVGGTR